MRRRQPEVRDIRIDSADETWRHDSDDGSHRSVRLPAGWARAEGLANDVAAASVPPLPQVMADHHRAAGTWFVFAGIEQATDLRPGADQFEIARRDGLSTKPFGPGLGPVGHPCARRRFDRFETSSALPQIDHVGIGNIGGFPGSRCGGPDADQAFSVRNGRCDEQYRIDQRGHEDGRAEAERRARGRSQR
jgi:hypothetical protein